MKLTIHIDGGARGNPGPAAAAVVIRRDDHPAQLLHETAYHLGTATNNVAEYQALLRALELAISLRPDEVMIHSDSELMVRQITGQYKVRSPDLLPLFEKAQSLLLKLDSWQIKHVYREQNRRADELVNLALDAGQDVVIKSSIPGQTNSNAAGAAPAPRPAPRPAPGNPGATKDPAEGVPGATSKGSGVAGIDDPQWTVTLQADPGDQCPAGCKASGVYKFGPSTPPAFCVHATQAMLRVVDLDEDASRSAQPRHVTCGRCGVAMRLDFA